MAEPHGNGSKHLQSEATSKFLLVLQEATRARPNTADSIFIPPVNAAKIEANYHHLVFGQRGSGKSTLLRQLQADKMALGQMVVWIDQEVFANLSFPDVLVSSIEALFKEVNIAVLKSLAAQRKSVPKWRRALHRNSSENRLLKKDLTAAISNLQALKFAPIESSIEWTRSHAKSSRKGLIGGISVSQVRASAERSNSTDQKVESRETVFSSKREYLERSLPDYRELLTQSARLTGGGIVLIDDLYHLDPADQPRVLGYMHRLVKDTDLWLKIGSIRYLTRTYTSAEQPVGMQAGHDAHLIALDDGMQRLKLSTDWLESILRELAPRADASIDELFSPGSLGRLALASGCIARDYLTISGAAIEEARNRPPSTKSGTHRVTVEDVNRAAGVLAPAKLDDMDKDAPETAASVRGSSRFVVMGSVASLT